MREDREVSLRELSMQLAAWENDVHRDAVTHKQRMRVYTALRQSHLPKLDENDVVEFDSSAGVIELTDDASELEVYLDVVPHDEIPWSTYYLGLGNICAGAVVLSWVEIFPLSAFPELGLAALVTALFVGSAIAHRYYERQNRLGSARGAAGPEGGTMVSIMDSVRTVVSEHRTAVNVVGILVLVAVVAPFLVVGVPQLAGASESHHVVLSDSMNPTFESGDVILVEDVDPETIEEGNVITYADSSGERTTHRVVEVVEEDGERYFQTKGDANEDPDATLVPAGAVEARHAHAPLHRSRRPFRWNATRDRTPDDRAGNAVDGFRAWNLYRAWNGTEDADSDDGDDEPNIDDRTSLPRDVEHTARNRRRTTER